MKKGTNSITLSDLTKGNVWDLQESDIFMLWENAERDDDVMEHAGRYMDIIRSAFEVEEVKIDKPEIIRKYEARGMRVGVIPVGGKDKKWAVKKRPINRVTDLTYDNIFHISAAKLLEVIDRNFGGGWDSLTQSTRDIIEKGFDVSTTTLPKDRLHKPGGLCELKLADGYEMLEIVKGTWVEAIFVKAKPKMLKFQSAHHEDEANDPLGKLLGGGLDSDEGPEVDDTDDYYKLDEDDDDLDDDSLTEESYRTTIEEDPDQLSLNVADIDDDGDEDY